MTLSKEIWAILATILFLGLGTLVLYEVHAVKARQDAIETQIVAQKQLADNITRAMETWATKADLQALATASNTNLQAIQQDLATLNSSLTAMNVATATSTAQNLTNQGSTSVVKPTTPPPAPPTVTCDGKQISCPNQDPNGYLSTTQQYTLNEDFGTLKVPFGTVSFNGSTNKPWSETIPVRQYQMVTVLGTDENQRISAYNQLSINVNGHNTAVPITSSQIKQIYPAAKFSWLNPRLYLGADAGLTVNNLPIQAAGGPNLNVQVMSYGRYKTQPDLSVLQLGVAYDIPSKKIDFMLRPIAYNIGQHLPLMNNLYLGPALHVGTTGAIAVTLGLSAGL